MPSRERIKELLPVLQAFAEGKAVQWKDPSSECWTDFRDDDPHSGLGFHNNIEYRVKPEPVKHEVWVNAYFDKSVKEFRITHNSLYRTEEYAKKSATQFGASLAYLGPIKLEYTEEL